MDGAVEGLVPSARWPTRPRTRGWSSGAGGWPASGGPGRWQCASGWAPSGGDRLQEGRPQHNNTQQWHSGSDQNSKEYKEVDNGDKRRALPPVVWAMMVWGLGKMGGGMGETFGIKEPEKLFH